MTSSKSIFRATALLSSSSLLSIVLSFVVAKILATYLQPEGYGYYGLLQSFVAVASLLAGMGMATGIVRIGARPIAENDSAAMASLRRACWMIFSGLGCSALLVLSIFRRAVSNAVLGDHDHGTTILLTSIALLFTVAANIQVGILNSYHRVGALAKYGVANTALSSLVSIIAVLIWKKDGILVAVIGGSVATWVVSRFFLSRELGNVPSPRVSWDETWKSARQLLRFGTPFTASMLVGTGVQLVLPMIVLHLLNPESVGYFRAAAGISVGYLGFLITAMGQDYYPRVAAVSRQPEELVKLVNAQHRLVMLVAVPLILFTLAVVPYAVPLVYSIKFKPTVEILEWQLIGDIFKFASWTMSFAILARCSSSIYFMIECTGGVVTLLTTWIGVRWFGLTGLGSSFLCTYVIYYLVVWAVIRREIPLRWTSSNKRMLWAGIAAACLVRALPYTRFSNFRTYIALLLALAAGAPSAWIIWKEFRDPQATGLTASLAAKLEQPASL